MGISSDIRDVFPFMSQKARICGNFDKRLGVLYRNRFYRVCVDLEFTESEKHFKKVTLISLC